jgi:hypothetical protein
VTAARARVVPPSARARARTHHPGSVARPLAIRKVTPWSLCVARLPRYPPSTRTDEVLPLIAPLFFLAAGLLVVAGVGKAWRPRPTTQALYGAGLPGSEIAVRCLGLVEMVAGAAALMRPATWNAVVVAVLYLAFGGFVTFLLLARPAATSCGCSGTRETPPSWLHVAMDVAAAAVASIAAVVSTPSLADAVRSLGALMLPAALGLTVAGWLAIVVVAELPRSFRSWTPPSHHEQDLFDPDRHRRAEVALTTSGVNAGHASLWPDHDPTTGAPLSSSVEAIDVGH